MRITHFAFFALGLAGCGRTESAPPGPDIVGVAQPAVAAAPAKPAPAPLVELYDVESLYRSNEALAEEQYGRKRLRFFVNPGSVSKISDDKWTLYINDSRLSAPLLFFPPDAEPALAKLNFTRLVEVEGTCSGKVGGVLCFTDCRVLSNDKPIP
jgi:hypothetical protein